MGAEEKMATQEAAACPETRVRGCVICSAVERGCEKGSGREGKRRARGMGVDSRLPGREGRWRGGKGRGIDKDTAGLHGGKAIKYGAFARHHSTGWIMLN